MSPEEILQFLRGQAQGLMAGDQPAKASRRAPSPSVLPVDVTGRTEPVVFYRDAYGNVVRVPDAARPAPAPAPMPQPAPQHDPDAEAARRGISMSQWHTADSRAAVERALHPAPSEPESGYVRSPEAVQNDLALNPRHTADSRAAAERLMRIMQQLPSNTRTRSR